MIRGILKIILIIGLVYGATYLIPKDARQKAVSKLGSMISAITPASVKEKMEPVIFSPAQRRQKLLNQLQKNIESIKTDFTASKPANKTGENTTSSEDMMPQEQTPEEIIQTLEETKKIIEEIQEINNDQGVVNKVTTKIYKTVTGGETETNESFYRENE